MLIWSTDINAPGCPGEVIDTDGDSTLVQTDYDYPGTAGMFGWSTYEVQRDGQRCDHQYTDGTVDCPDCGVTAGEFIAAAGDWLYDNDGATDCTCSAGCADCAVRVEPVKCSDCEDPADSAGDGFCLDCRSWNNGDE